MSAARSSLGSRTRWRRHWRYPAAAVILAGFLVVGLGGSMIIPYVSPGSWGAEAARTLGRDVDNVVDILDDAIVHTIAVDMDEADYDLMLGTYRDDGVKEFFPATVTLDGVRLERVGVRLKGNSTLFGLFLGFDLRRMMAAGGGDAMRMGRPLPGEEGPPARPAAPPANPPGTQPFPDPSTLPPPPAPEVLPYLLQFDEFVPGQTYQGLRQLALREDGPTGDASLLPEIVTAKVLLGTGLVTTMQAYTGLSFNGSEERLFLVSEVPDDEMARRSFPGTDGYLIKANTGAPFRYLGPDQTDYADWFEVDSSVRRHDLAPLIGFLRSVQRSSDAEFAAGLEDHLDVGSFAAYLAVHNLLANADSLGGMGNNYYLFYDLGRRRFSVVSWDVNGGLGRITFGADPVRYDPHYGDPVRFGGRPGPGKEAGAGEQGGPPSFGGAAFPGASRMRRLMPEGGEFGTNLLGRRFLAAPSFRARYDETYRRLHRDVLVAGLAQGALRRYAATVTGALRGRPSLVDAGAFEALAESNLEFLEQRRDALTAVPPLAP